MTPEPLPLVLVVDDDPTLRVLARAALEPHGFAVEEAVDGVDALRRYQTQRPDLVLLDVNLPRADGFAVCAEIRQWGNQTPVLMMTGRDDVDAIGLAYEAGATDFIGKPLNWTILVHRVRYLLRSAHEARELGLLVTAVAQAHEAIVVTDHAAVIRYVNPAFERITGYSAAEAVGKKTSLLKSGRQDDAFYARLWLALSRGETWRGSLVNRRKTGELYEEDCTISPVRGVGGVTVHFVAVKRDVTHEQALERQLREAQRLEALGTMAGGVAHDFNNLLTPVIGYAEMALGILPAESPVRRHLGKILGAAERGRELVKQMMAFSQQGLQSRKPLRLAALVGEVLSLIKASAPDNVTVRQPPAQGRDVILAEQVQIHQMLINLCTNAIHAMKGDGGTLEVCLEEVSLLGSAPPHPGLKEGGYVRLTVSDTGHGMAPEVVERIFEPFFTTKGPGEGTGIGLAAAYGVVNRHGGAVTVQSEPGRGTRFDVYLPCVQDEPAAEPAREQEGATARRAARILFVDDEEAVVAVARDMLEDLGYLVETANGAATALELFRSQPERFDLAITDMTMPGMSGTQLARALRNVSPELPIVLSTGYSEAITPAGAASVGIQEFLMKPWNRLELACAVRRVLGAAADGPSHETRH